MDGGEMLGRRLRWRAHDPRPGDESNPSWGNGVPLWFATDDLAALVERVNRAGAKVLDGTLYNPNGRQHEIWLEASGGYRELVAGPRGQVG